WDGSGDALPVERLRPIHETLRAPGLRPELRRFVERVAAYTISPPGAVLRMAMSVPDALQPRRPRRLCAISAAGMAAQRLTPARRRVLEILRGTPLLP